MSATSATPVSHVFLQRGDNQFKLSDHEKKTHVTLNLQQSGPLIQGSSQGSPSLDYQGDEGTLSFSGEQITTVDTLLGRMYTVALNIVPDLRTLDFSLFIPSVTHKTQDKPQHFETIAIKSEHHTSLQGTPTTTGADVTYSVVKMHGTAENVVHPL